MFSIRASLVVALALLFAPTLPELQGQSLKGSRRSVNHMYAQAVGHGVYFYKTGKGVRNAASEGRLVRLSGNRSYRLHNVSFPYVRPATRTFVERLSEQYRNACGERLVVTSATRPRSGQPRNSVPKSVHPAGIAIDLRKPRGRCLSWLRETLLSLERAGVVEATEERRPPHFHVAVFPKPYERYVRSRGGAVVASGGDAKRYRIRKGDSLWGIARRHGTSVTVLKRANDLSSSRVRVGQVIEIPSGR